MTLHSRRPGSGPTVRSFGVLTLFATYALVVGFAVPQLAGVFDPGLLRESLDAPELTTLFLPVLGPPVLTFGLVVFRRKASARSWWIGWFVAAALVGALALEARILDGLRHADVGPA